MFTQFFLFRCKGDHEDVESMDLGLGFRGLGRRV